MVCLVRRSCCPYVSESRARSELTLELSWNLERINSLDDFPFLTEI